MKVLKENENQESIINEIFKRITSNHRLSWSQQQTKAKGTHPDDKIRMSINLS